MVTQHPTAGAQTRESSPAASSNSEFLRALALALVALAVSAAVLLTAYVSFSPQLAALRAATSAADIQARVIKGHELMLRLGTGERNPDQGLVLNELAQEGRAIMTRRTSLNANDYPYVRYTINERHPGEIIYLIWRTADNPEQPSRVRLYWSGEKPTTYLLAGHAQWHGRITEIGYEVYGDLRSQPLVVSRLEALPYSISNWLASVWSEWSRFETWKHSSINYLRAAPPGAIMSPTAAMAAWAGTALLLLLLAFSLKKTRHPLSYAAVVLIPWIALDLLWQNRLSTQLEETTFLFAGKSPQEKHLADRDTELYQYARHLNSDVLPRPGARIFILADNKGEVHEYRRLRTQFHLLPHNIYNYGSLPSRKHVRDGDYLLVLGDIADLAFEPDKKVLRWGEGKRLNVALIDQHPVGTIYRVTRRDSR